MKGAWKQFGQEAIWSFERLASPFVRALRRRPLVQLLVGVIYNPVSGELYQAVKGCGARLNGERISVSGATNLGEAMVVSLRVGKKLVFHRVVTYISRASNRRAVGVSNR